MAMHNLGAFLCYHPSERLHRFWVRPGRGMPPTRVGEQPSGSLSQAVQAIHAHASIEFEFG
jgi:hypothetical protein